VTVEGFFLQNAIVNAGLLWFAAAWRGDRARPLNVLFGASLGAAYAVAAALVGGALRSGLALAFVSVAMVAALGKCSVRDIARSAGALWVGAAVLGGTHAMGIPMLPAGIVSGLSGASLLRRKNAPPPRAVRLTIVQGDRSLTMDAIVDTGNRALDPSSGLPVVFVARGGWDSSAGSVVCIRTAAGTALLPCFAPDMLLVDGEPQRAIVACCEEGSLECALVPWVLCAERKAKNALARDQRQKEFLAQSPYGTVSPNARHSTDASGETFPREGGLHRGSGCIARAAHTR